MIADVVLIHGLARTSHVMAKMAKHLTSQGYNVANLDYHSTRYPLEVLTEQIAEKIANFRTHLERPLHFVVHSMGSIIIHLYIKKYAPANLGRVVALGPPYHGSAIVDHLGKYKWFQLIYGPAALELTTQSNGICRRLGTVNYDLGVIAGTRWIFFDWFFAQHWLEQPNDGKVSVASTDIEGCRERIELPIDHVFMPEYDIVISQSAYFLSQGRFFKA